MKIWYQAVTRLGKDPVFRVHEAALNSYLNSIARPGTEVVVHGVEIASPYIELYLYEELLHNRQIVENVLRAQREGFDGFCVGNMFDFAYYALREVADIPVCNLAEASMLLACLLSPNFSLLAINKAQLRRELELVKRYGLQDRFIETAPFSPEVPLAELQQAFADPEIFLQPAREIAADAKKKEVCMFVNSCGCTNMIIAKHGIHEIEGIPVLEGGGALIKITEMLVDLKKMGINRSHLGLFTPISKAELASIRECHGQGTY